MEKRNFHLRIAKPEDAEEILKVYAPYVEKTAITFEYEVPSVEEFRGRIENTLQHYPYLVAEDETGILGYAYAGRFQTRGGLRLGRGDFNLHPDGSEASGPGPDPL